MVFSKEYERVLRDLIELAKSEWDLERLEKALSEARARVSNMRYELKQQEFKEKRDGK